MSIWTSVRRGSDEKLDVAYSLHQDQIRLVLGDETVMLSVDETSYLIKKLKIAIGKTVNN